MMKIMMDAGRKGCVRWSNLEWSSRDARGSGTCTVPTALFHCPQFRFKHRTVASSTPTTLRHNIRRCMLIMRAESHRLRWQHEAPLRTVSGFKLGWTAFCVPNELCSRRYSPGPTTSSITRTDQRKHGSGGSATVTSVRPGTSNRLYAGEPD
jgi:hypothetical protein